MSAPTPDTEQAFATLDRMFDADVLRHLVAISEDGKVTARSFKHARAESVQVVSRAGSSAGSYPQASK